jgi:hypothetical protein
VLHVDMVKGNKIVVDVAAKGGGSENKSKFKMMNPSDSIVDWVLEMLPQMGAGWCPPGMLGIGIGGTAEHCVLLAKKALMEPIDMAQLKERGPQTDIERLRIEIFDKVNALGIGAQGLGGLTTMLDVKIMDAPCHAAGKPVAMIPNCAATRHAHFVLDGSGPSFLNAQARRMAASPLGSRRCGQARRPRHADGPRRPELEAGRPPAAQRQDADRPRRRAQAHPGHAGQGRKPAGRVQGPRDLLRRPGRSGA